MGNSNATASLTEEESSKLETNGMSPLEYVSVETTQDQVFLAGEGKDGEQEKESSKLETNGMSASNYVSVVSTQDQVFLEGEGKDGEQEKETSKLETNGMSASNYVSVVITQDQVFLEGEGKDGDQEKEISKLETNGMSSLDSVSIDTTQDQLFLVGEEKDGDKEKESLKLETNGMSLLDSVSVETTQDQLFLAGEGKVGDEEKESLHDGVTETEPQNKQLVDESKVKNVEEEMHPSGLKTDEQLQKQASVEEGVETVCEVREVAELPIISTQSVVGKLNTTESNDVEKLCVVDDIKEGVQTVCEATEVEELLSMIGTHSVVSKLNTTESSNEEKLSVVDELVSVSPSFSEGVKTEANMVNESQEEIVSSGEAVKLDQENGMEQRTGREELLEIEPQEIRNLDYRVVVDEEVTNEGKADKAISKPGSQESDTIQETGLGVYKDEKVMELKRKASLKRMSRCRSLPVSHNSRVIGDLSFQQLVSEVAFPSRNKKGIEKANTSETMRVSCVGSNKAQETMEAITESKKEARLEMRSPSFGNDLRIEERIDESTEKTPLLCQDKTEIYEETIDVEEKTVMLKRSESVKTRGLEMSIGFLKKHSDSFKETKGSGDNLVDKKASSGAMEGIVRKRSKSSLLGTCLCCTTAMN